MTIVMDEDSVLRRAHWSMPLAAIRSCCSATGTEQLPSSNQSESSQSIGHSSLLQGTSRTVSVGHASPSNAALV